MQGESTGSVQGGGGSIQKFCFQHSEIFFQHPEIFFKIQKSFKSSNLFQIRKSLYQIQKSFSNPKISFKSRNIFFKIQKSLQFQKKSNVAHGNMIPKLNILIAFVENVMTKSTKIRIITFYFKKGHKSR